MKCGYLFKWVVLGLLFATPGFVGAANYTLDIVNIDEVGANNRIRFAYPGISYRVVIAAEGGDYPYTWSLTANTNCTSVSIDSDDGEITWTPTAGQTGCTIEALVTDASAATDTESYTVTVTDSTDRFLFVQDGYSGTKNGSISQPYEDISEIWDTVTDTNKILYFRTGTYYIPHIAENNRNGCYRVWVENATDPVGFLGYPGETATIDEEGGSGAGYAFNTAGSDHYFAFLTFTNTHYYGLVFSSSDYVTLYNCTFGQAYTSDSASNQAYINYMSGASADKNVISHCTFPGPYSGGTNFQGVENYTVSHQVIQYSVFSDLPRGIFYKDGTNYSTVTKCQFLENIIAGFDVYGQNGCQNNEIRFSYFNENAQDINTNTVGSINPTYFIRNTISNTTGGIYLRGASDTDHTCTFLNNAIQDPYTDTGTIGTDAFQRHRTYFRYMSETEYNQVTYTDNLEATSGIIDASGLLVNRDYVGTYGWETAAAATTHRLRAKPLLP